VARIIINNGNAGTLFLHSELITHFEADGNYCRAFYADGKEQDLWLSMKRLEEILVSQLPTTAPPFLKVGRSLIVNVRYIVRITPQKHEMELHGTEMKEHLVLKASEVALTGLLDYLTVKLSNQNTH